MDGQLRYTEKNHESSCEWLVKNKNPKAILAIFDDDYSVRREKDF